MGKDAEMLSEKQEAKSSAKHRGGSLEKKACYVLQIDSQNE